MNQLNKVVSVKSVVHDVQLSLAAASNRNAVKWKNSDMAWSEFLNTIANTVRTKEAMAEYDRMGKGEQGAIKDVGGFVGGYLKNGRRKAENVMNRSLITLDIDYADDTILDTLSMLADYSWAVYSTHSHRAASPRYRLVVPVKRNVTSEEYEPIARKLAESIGMDHFDDTTYDVNRLMYWPSTSSDGEYVFTYEDNGLLDPDKLLKSYPTDWRDPLEWPQSSREGEKYQSLAKQQGDPHEKPGLVGAFNRAYTIHDVIDAYLSDVYDQFDENRYTFKDGSAAGGLVLYDNGKFAYSHHGTDPVSNTLVNSFDLLRLHKYGDQDAGKRHDTTVTKLPSYKAMTQFVQQDEGISEYLAQERLQRAQDEFGIIEDDEEDLIGNVDKKADSKWMSKLKINKAGEFESSIPNILLILDHDPNLKGRLAYNEFSYRMMRRGKTPWNHGKQHVPWTDDDDAGLRNYLEQIYDIHNKSKTDDAIKVTMNTHAFHPVRDYLDGLEWDGTERLDMLFIKYLGAEDSELNRTVTRIAFTAAVARIYSPGIKFDYMTTLYGSQGLGKSMLLNRMGKQWFSDSLTTVTGKEAFEALQGAWLIEMGELSATRKTDIESTKHFISKQEDRFRVAYGRHVEDFPRQCVFFGTTNDDSFLNDRTGNRRFWPIKVDGNRREDSWVNLEDAEIDQMWAEAIHNYENKLKLFLPKHLEDLMQETQEEHTAESPWFGIIEEYLNTKVPNNWEELDINQRKNYFAGEFDNIIEDEVEADVDNLVERDRVCSLEIWVECLGNDVKRFPPVERREINDVLRNMPGWQKYDGNKSGMLRFGKNYGNQRAFVKENDNVEDLI